MITIHQVKTITSDHDTREIIETISVAFRTDAAARWLFPDEENFHHVFGRFARAFAAPAFEHRTAHFTDQFAGAATWFPPRVNGEDEPVMEVIEEFVPHYRLHEAFALFEQMDRFHPEFPHWYLPLIGVAPGHQGEGIGSQLLQHVLSECDHTNTPAYLEASSPENLRLYHRHGFQTLGEIQSGSSPVIYPMLREPRPANTN